MNRVSILTHSFVDAYNGCISKIFGGGLERYIYDLCDVIKKMGMQPEVHQLSFTQPFQTVVEGIEVHGYVCADLNQIPEIFDTMAGKAGGLLIYASCIWHPIRYQKGSLGICHGLNWDHQGISAAQKTEIAKSVQTALDQLERIISVDSHFLTFCRSVCSYADPEKVVLLKNAVDTFAFQPRNDSNSAEKIRLLFPRRISFERGIIPMMLAADALLHKYPHVTIEFAGEVIENLSICEAFLIWMREHPHKERIYHRSYEFHQVAEAYQQADIAVIPSVFSEGTSYSCLEALSCGLPVVASNVGGLNDLILDGFNGLLIPPVEKQITAAISKLIEDAALRKRLGRNARETALAFDKAVWKEKWRELIENTMKTNANQFKAESYGR